MGARKTLGGLASSGWNRDFVGKKTDASSPTLLGDKSTLKRKLQAGEEKRGDQEVRTPLLHRFLQSQKPYIAIFIFIDNISYFKAVIFDLALFWMSWFGLIGVDKAPHDRI